MKKFYCLSGLFLLLILCCATPARSQNSVQAGKTVSGINGVPVTSVQVTFDNELAGAVLVSWECTPSAGFLYYALQRDGLQIAIFPTAMTFNDFLSQYGTYTYCVIAMYDTGPATPTCDTIEWANPTMVWSPVQLTATLFPGTNEDVSLFIGNTSDNTLAFQFPDWVDHPGDSPLAYCPAFALNEDEFISGVKLGTINNSSGWSAYTDYTSISTDLYKTQSYPVIITLGPPSYPGDITGVWIDFDHSSTFEVSEFTLLTGINPATGTISVPATALTGPTTMRVRTQYNGTLSPCGTSPYGEVEDYTVVIHGPNFITDVTPASGIVEPHSTPGMNVHTTFSATGQFSAAGVYTSQLMLESNDTSHPSVSIPVIMTVMTPGYIQGLVTDCITGDPISGVLVHAGSYTAMTDDTGFYSMAVSPGSYTMNFSKTGFQILVVLSSASAGITTTVNAQLCETPYPPACAHASVNFEDTECTVSWCPPDKRYELMYDDGTAENYAAWEFAGNRYAVKFTPQAYPAKVMGAKIFIGDGPNGNAFGSNFCILVCKADASGLPGQVIDSVASSIVYTTGWLYITGLAATVTSGDFFIVMIQGQPTPDCPYLGVDETPPMVNKSYSRDVVNGGDWEVSAYQDFMIRAIVSSPDTGSVTHYSVTRIFLGATNPVPPESGVFTLINSSETSTSFIDHGWLMGAPGWYAYGIQANYPGQSSEHTYTNMVPHKMFSDLTINAQLECGLLPAEGAVVKLTGNNYPYDILTDTVPASGTLTFSQIIKGEYTISVTYPDYENFTQSISLFSNEVVNAVLLQIRNKPLNLHVSENELVATWQAPRGILMSEDFEGSFFPSSGWSVSSWGMGWYSATNGSSDSLVIPSHTTYAVVNDQLGGASNNGCCDYLHTPMLDLRGSPDYTLTFSSFFNGLNGQLGYVEISTDYGATWTPLYTCQSTYGFWETKTIDLSAYSGPSGSAGVMFAFHADDAGNQASGWAIDDVSVTYGGLAVSGYKVYLDGSDVGQTTELTWPFDPDSINCGQVYQVGVAAIYCTGDSDTATYDFTNFFEYPPSNLAADTSITAISGAVILTWQTPMNCYLNLVEYRIYRTDTSIAMIAALPPTVNEFWDTNLLPGFYCYDITAVYDLTPYGMPGMLGESIKDGPACADIIYGSDLPFSDDFSGGAFDTTMWNPGQNWLVDEDSDNPVPTAKFKWDPLMTNYSSALESFFFDISSENYSLPFKVWFDYDIRLEDQLASSTEKLTVEVWDGTTWNPVKEYTNTGSSVWESEHMNITSFASEQPFKVRFRANGSSSDAIHYWAIDNVQIYVMFIEPAMLNLVTQLVTQAGNEIYLDWNSPEEYYTTYCVDDGTAEDGISLISPSEGWIGNEFPVTMDEGVLHKAWVFLNANGSAVYSIDVFDADKTLIGSSEPFIPLYGNMTGVNLPDIPYAGTFYLMLHIITMDQSGILSLDTNGPYAQQNLAWFYDGSGWSKLTDAGFEPCVCFIRAEALCDDGKSSFIFGPGSLNTGYISPVAGSLVHNLCNAESIHEIIQVPVNPGNTDSLTGYNVYRRAYTVFPAGQNNSTSGDWTKIATVTETEFTDQYLSNLVTNCYEYRVTAVYTEGESIPSNIDWECIFTEVKPNPGNEVNLYPNPATTFIRIELNGDISNLKVFNSLGLLVTEENTAGETTVVLNTSGYAAGIYTAKFTTRKGDSFSRKFVVGR